ncbi:MAG: PolC-type DNA polymerase III, partial [Clostridia bacterium]|nr:PolC-type DNA polymerase III [Clostridia bacterium]
LEDFTGVDAKKIPLNDKETMGIFSGVWPLKLREEKLLNTAIGTIGIPEFGTKFVRGMLEETKPGTFAELVRISGLSHGTDVWLNNAQELIKNKIATLNETIACRDDVMVYLIEKGLPSLEAFKIMEDVRKGKGLKQEYRELMYTHGVPDWYIDSCEKIKYMFPKAHAVAYVTMAFRIAYFKVKYPEAFYAAFFSVRGGDFDAELICQGENKVMSKMQEIEVLGNNATAKEKGLYNILEVALEMYLRGIKPRMIDLWESDSFKFKIANGQLLCPFISLQGLGEIAAKKIIETREKGEITSIEDLQNKTKLTKNVVQVLKENGILKGLPEKNQLTLF